MSIEHAPVDQHYKDAATLANTPLFRAQAASFVEQAGAFADSQWRELIDATVEVFHTMPLEAITDLADRALTLASVNFFLGGENDH